MTKASRGNLPHRGYTPTLYEKCHGIFNDHRESGPRFNVSSERRYVIASSLVVALKSRVLNYIVGLDGGAVSSFFNLVKATHAREI